MTNHNYPLVGGAGLCGHDIGQPSISKLTSTHRLPFVPHVYYSLHDYLLSVFLLTLSLFQTVSHRARECVISVEGLVLEESSQTHHPESRLNDSCAANTRTWY